MKKLTIIGRGTAGCLTAAYFSKNTDYEIDWIFDPNIKQQAVGEGTNLAIPKQLDEDLDFNVVELQDIFGTPKLGIRKINWGQKNKDFTHTFPGSMHGYHFNAVLLQDYIIQKLTTNSKIKLKNFHVNNLNDLDSDYIIDCSGKPNDFSGYEIREEIPVNAVLVTQCYWEGLRFTQTLTIARPYGWVFGIPLLNRCAIGYLYNKDINTLEEVEKDVKNVFEQFNLKPSQDINKFHFNNYIKKENHSDRITYNGNSSFFLEPLEATSLSTVVLINKHALRIFEKNLPAFDANFHYKNELNNISNMIMCHYFAGSTFNTEFWTQAKLKAEISLKKSIQFPAFVKMVEACNSPKNKQTFYNNTLGEVGTWPLRSYVSNLTELGIKEKLQSFIRNSASST
jgi:Tryptophan halogenase